MNGIAQKIAKKQKGNKYISDATILKHYDSLDFYEGKCLNKNDITQLPSVCFTEI